MNLVDGIEPITVLKTRSAELINRARESGEPVIITQNGRPTAVLQDVESFQKQRETLLLLKLLVQGDRDHQAGRSLAHTRARARLRKTLEKLTER